ncbi:Crp/Fnr family transcriptional regulator [Enterococcus faecalis]|uniref:Crp/Fnr family transcriptional regulator n=1 Tax=Enterococcus faecalis TaxID=1351 RepID=UPI00132F85AF|nr:Crp/Fnr family transcriptional regulator [Enterococcus faecalis]
MESDYLTAFLDRKKTPIIKKKRHTYLAYHGLEEAYTYVLKKGVVKTSIILKDGREFNLSYAPFNIRIESEEASFYRIPRTVFWEYVREDAVLQDYVRDYYRAKLSESISSLQNMTMNGKKGAVCTFIYQLIDLFGVQTEEGILIDFQVTNEDIAGFCGISTRNSVNRIIHDLKEEKVIDIKKQKIVIYDQSYLADYIDR